MHKKSGIQFNLRYLLLGVALFCAVVFVARFFIWPLLLPLTPGYWDDVEDNYALWQAEEMLSLYIARDTEQVPVRWEDLVEEYKATNMAYNTTSLSSLEDRVLIDFSALEEAMLTGSTTTHITEKPIIRLRAQWERRTSKLTDEEQKVNERLRKSLQSLARSTNSH